MKVEISIRAAIQRINRQLIDEKIVTARTEKARRVFGRYYVVHLERGVVTYRDIDLAEWARDCDVLKNWEVVEKPRKKR